MVTVPPNEACEQAPREARWREIWACAQGGIVQNALDDDRKEARAKETGTVVKAISAEFSGVVGANPSCALAEEQHKWWMPNPSLGITISHERLAKEYGVVKDDPNPEALRTFCS